MKWRYLLLLVFASPCFAGNLISSMTWTEGGDYKMAREDAVPWDGTRFVSTMTISRLWDGTTIKLFGAKGEMLKWVTYLEAGAAGSASNVMVKISSFTGTGAALGTGFAAVAVSSSSVWDYSTRPYSLYKYAYIQQIGMPMLGGANDPTEYDEYQVAPRFQVPCTLNGFGGCTPNGGTYTWANRQDHNKFYPDPAVPIEEYSISSFTVAASSSQAIGGEVYISTGLIAGATYQATLTVYEGVAVSTTIPIALYVYNVTLPSTATIPVFAYMGYGDMDAYIYNNEFPASDYVDPYLTTHIRAAAFLHRHKIITIGDPGTAGQDYPSVDYAKHIDGSAYKEAYGLAYNTGPGYGVGDSKYFIGTYGHWQSASWSTSTVTNGSTGYCDNVSSWTAYCTTNNLTCQLYTSDDEASNAILAAKVNTLSTWTSTAPACASGSNRLSYFQTGNLLSVSSLAPNVNAVVSTGWFGPNTTGSSATWVTTEALYNTSSTHSAGGYNEGIGSDAIDNTAEEGLATREVMWGAYKTNQSMWFLWDSNYWIDSNNGGQTANGFNANSSNENDNFNISKNFGYDNYPTTDSIKGHTGFGFSNKSGMILYPGTDQIYANPSFGFNGVIGSWRLNQLTRGIQDVDIIRLAYAVDPTATTAIVNQQVRDVMYLRQCVDLADCTYSAGQRPWNENLGTWETAREALLVIAANGTTTPTVTTGTKTFSGSGKITGNGRIQ